MDDATSMEQMVRECEAEYARLGCILFYVDNPHPSWFGARSKHRTATGLSEESEMSPYKTAESRHVQTKFYPRYRLQDNEHMHRGRGQELHILRTFCERRGYHLLQVALLISQTDVRLAATPDGLAMAVVLRGPEREPCFMLFDLEAKCPIVETVLPPIMYLAQMAAQLEVTELRESFLITHSSGGKGRCWKNHRSAEFFGWLRRCAHRGLQYDACGLSHTGREWSTRGLRGFVRPGKNYVNQPMFPRLYDNTVQELGRRLETQRDGQSLLGQYFAKRVTTGTASLAEPDAVAPLPQVQWADQYEVPLLCIPAFEPKRE